MFPPSQNLQAQFTTQQQRESPADLCGRIDHTRGAPMIANRSLYAMVLGWGA
jgi:hypothetical protein